MIRQIFGKKLPELQFADMRCGSGSFLFSSVSGFYIEGKRTSESAFLFVLATSQSPGLPETLATAYNPGMCLLELSAMLFRSGLLDRFKVSHTVFAERADEVIRKYISFIDISADLADKAFLSFCVRFRLYVVLII